MSDDNKNMPASKESEILDLLKRVEQKLTFLETKIERLLQQSQSAPRPRERSSERFSPRDRDRDQKKPFSKPFRPGGARPSSEERESRYGAKKPSFKNKKFVPRGKPRP